MIYSIGSANHQCQQFFIDAIIAFRQITVTVIGHRRVMVMMMMMRRWTRWSHRARRIRQIRGHRNTGEAIQIHNIRDHHFHACLECSVTQQFHFFASIK